MLYGTWNVFTDGTHWWSLYSSSEQYIWLCLLPFTLLFRINSQILQRLSQPSLPLMLNSEKRKHGNTFNQIRQHTDPFFFPAAQTWPAKQEHIENSNFQYASQHVDPSIEALCLSDLCWMTEVCVNSRYTGADCNISSLPGRLASINRPIHHPGVLPLTRVSEASEGNKWWREGINQRQGEKASAPLTGPVKSRDGTWWKG